MRTLHALWLSFVLLSGCAALGIPQPQTLNQKIAAGETAGVAAVDVVSTLLTAKKITADDATNVLAQIDNVMVGLKVARQFAVTDPAAAQTKLSATLTVLQSIQTYLQSKGGS